MTKKTKSRAGGNQATLQTTSKSYSTSIVTYIKAAAVTLVLWGYFPLKWADWINQWGDRK